jgi:hypothetical protein
LVCLAFHATTLLYRNASFLMEINMAAVTVSANLDERDAQKLRLIAAREHRSVSSLVASAAAVFADLPKDLRDTLLELRVDEGQTAFRSVVREFAAMVARKKFELASRRLAAQRLLPTIPEDASDQEILDLASELVRKP